MKPCRKITVILTGPPNTKTEVHVFHAAKGKMYNAKLIEAQLDAVADFLEVKRPNEDFRLVELSGHRYKFIWEGFRTKGVGECIVDDQHGLSPDAISQMDSEQLAALVEKMKGQIVGERPNE
jgi:hypothetical protein